LEAVSSKSLGFFEPAKESGCCALGCAAEVDMIEDALFNISSMSTAQRPNVVADATFDASKWVISSDVIDPRPGRFR
jgi:hypothetical protein